MAIAAVTSTSQVFGATGGTTTTITTTGANLLVVALTYFKSAGPNISDSKGNTWNILTRYEDAGSNTAVVIYYASNALVGTGHSFTTTSHFCGVNVLAVSGARTASTPFDQENGGTSGSVSSFQPGSITPSVSGCLIITSVMQQAAVGAPTIPAGYTTIGTYAVGTAYPGGAAYIIQGAIAAQNPTWTVDPAGGVAANVASFMPPAVAVVNTGNFFNFF